MKDFVPKCLPLVRARQSNDCLTASGQRLDNSHMNIAICSHKLKHALLFAATETCISPALSRDPKALRQRD